MLDKNSIFKLLKENNQNPKYLEKSTTLIQTDNAGIFYTLSYSGDGSRIGWTMSISILKELKEYPTSFILLIDSINGKMYIIPNGDIDIFLQSLEEKNGVYKIDMNKIKNDRKNINYEISLENFHEYIRSC